jgi:hypothetical protein
MSLMQPARGCPPPEKKRASRRDNHASISALRRALPKPCHRRAHVPDLPFYIPKRAAVRERVAALPTPAAFCREPAQHGMERTALVRPPHERQGLSFRGLLSDFG